MPVFIEEIQEKMEVERGEQNSGKSGVRLKVCSACNVKRDNLQVAPYFVCAYFSLETSKLRRICLKCFEEAENHQKVLVNLLSEHKSVVSGPKKPKNEIEIVDLDADDGNAESDEELEQCQEEVELTEDVEQFVESIMEKYQFSKQLQDASIHLRDKCAVAKEEMTKLDMSISVLENNICALRKELFEPYEPIICYVDSVDIDEEGKVSKHQTTLSSSAFLETGSTCRKERELPPVGEFIHKPIQVLQIVYAMKTSLLKPWVKGTIVKIKENTEMPYEVRFENAADKPSRTFPLKYLAYAKPSPVQFTVGARIIAQYVGEKYEMLEPLAYYAGIIAEEAKSLTQERYLVFFDQGYAQYCKHEQIMMVCHSSRDVWHDVYSKSRAFVSTYLKGYPERAMVKLQRGQTIKTELNGYWFRGRVDAVDGSLAKIYFPSEKRFEWIYRGSTRFRHLYDLLAKEEARKKQGTTRPTRPTHNMVLVHQKKNAPYVEYTGEQVDDSSKPLSPPLLAPQLPSASKENPIRAVARKSTSKVFKSPPVVSTHRRTREPDVDNYGRLTRQLNSFYQQIYFEPHQCGTYCVKEYLYVDGENKNVNPFSIPMRWGWARELAKQRHGERSVIVFYRAPCGRRMRNLGEVHRFLRITGSELGIDLFCFDSFVQCFKEFKPDIIYCQIKDISYGKENVRVSCVNSVDRQNPLYVDYCTERIPRKGVKMNLDPNFLICCDCTDDCQDKEKCQCWQLTINATARGPGGKINPNAGYEYRRLTQNLRTGVYECNSRCLCRKTCLNRVAQRPLHLRLQLFRTVKCGWGIRCLDDIPNGQFICVYVGELLTDQDANDDGTQFGDEYLADLNFIELIENQKDGYESECFQSDQQSSESQSSTSDDDWDESSDASGSKNYPSAKRGGKRGRLSKMSKLLSRTPVKPIDVDDDGQEDGQKNFTRTLYGPMEKCFVIDARNIGNIGRYFNHSCEPNIFVQNIFIDTQDLRFPWVGFFAQEFIRAGTELTWDYGYQIDSVPGKKLFCYCGAKNCRRRLL